MWTESELPLLSVNLTAFSSYYHYFCKLEKVLYLHDMINIIVYSFFCATGHNYTVVWGDMHCYVGLFSISESRPPKPHFVFDTI